MEDVEQSSGVRSQHRRTEKQVAFKSQEIEYAFQDKQHLVAI